MNPITFPEANLTYAKDQPEYLPLPAYRQDDGTVVSCWKLSWREALRLLLTRRLWLLQLTFHAPLQPQLPLVKTPFASNNHEPIDQR